MSTNIEARLTRIEAALEQQHPTHDRAAIMRERREARLARQARGEPEPEVVYVFGPGDTRAAEMHERRMQRLAREALGAKP